LERRIIWRASLFGVPRYLARFNNCGCSLSGRAFARVITGKPIQILIIFMPVCRGHISYVKAHDPEQPIRFRPVPGRETRELDGRVREVNLDFELIFEGDRVIAYYVKLAGFDRACLYAHTLFAHVEDLPLDQARAMPFVALINDRHTHRERPGRRRYTPSTFALFKVARVLHGTNQLRSIYRAEAIVIRV
jgi:hypothetical protein